MSRVLAHRQRTGLTNVSVACYVAKAAGLAATKLAYLKTAAGRFPIRLVLTTQPEIASVWPKIPERTPSKPSSAPQTARAPDRRLPPAPVSPCSITAYPGI